MQLARSVVTTIVGLVLASASLLIFAQPKVVNGVLTDASGMTLYVFDNDATVPGKSACTGVCLNMWTPLVAEASAKPIGDYSLITRDDGKRQWAYQGKPLYRWYNDKKPGDQDGDGLRRVWHVARP